MAEPRAVVIPFGVPTEGRGLGLGLAALVHAFVHVEGDGVGLARLQSSGKDAPPSGPGSPVEAFVAPSTWLDISGGSDNPRSVSLVLTGAFEPPTAGQGAIQLLVFDARSGQTKARFEATVDEAGAGATLVGAFEQLWARVGGEIGALHGISELGWEALESVLLAERCALHDPAKGGRHDRLAAMLHFGRAIADAPHAKYPAARLAAIALETAASQEVDAKLTSAAARALERAATDAPDQVDLAEGLAALLLRLGLPEDARRWATSAVASAPDRPKPYALVARSLRARDDTDGALAVLQEGLAAAGADAALYAERGEILAERGDRDAAVAAWKAALAKDPVHPQAFDALARHALGTHDTITAGCLIDSALAAPGAHPDVLRWAARLALRTEEDGLARASRIANLCGRILEFAPSDPDASLVLAGALIVLGQTARARAMLVQIERTAPSTLAAAEAQASRLGIDDKGVRLEIDSVLRAATGAPVAALGDVAARARRLATLHAAWQGWLAAGLAESRRNRFVAARSALEAAIETAPGAVLAHIELVYVLLALEDSPAALRHAQRAALLDPESPQTIAAMIHALQGAGQRAEASAVLGRAVNTHPEYQRLLALYVAERGAEMEARSSARGWSRAWGAAVDRLWRLVRR